MRNDDWGGTTAPTPRDDNGNGDATGTGAPAGHALRRAVDRTSPSEPPAASGPYDPVGPREQRVLALARSALPAEIAAAESLLGLYLDLLGAVEEEYRLVWP